MARSDRLFRLLDALRRATPPVTAEHLARETGVSERTIYRDIETLRAGGALIDGEAGFGYTLTEDSAMPPQTFDRLELEAVMLGLSWLEWQGEPDMAAAARNAMAKVTASLPPRKADEARHTASVAYVFDKKPPAPPFMPLLRQSTWDERAVDISYTDREGRETERRIWPLSLAYSDYGPWVMAWCCLRQEFRRFLISRITSATETDESFRPRRVAMLRDLLAHYRG